jgi:hypothetical protein
MAKVRFRPVVIDAARCINYCFGEKLQEKSSTRPYQTPDNCCIIKRNQAGTGLNDIPTF